MELDLSTVQPSLAGPKRPQDRVELKNVKAEFFKSLAAPLGNTSFGLSADKIFGAAGTVQEPRGTSRTSSRTARSSSPRSPAAPTPATPTC
jgi:aconitase A